MLICEYTMDKELIVKLKAAAERNAKHLSELEKDPEYIEKVERYIRSNKISVEALHKVFDI
jgi:hypothetical protein